MTRTSLLALIVGCVNNIERATRAAYEAQLISQEEVVAPLNR